ncbi:MAG: HAD family phosphatase [Candidatus Delongbacteria bacterium]|jgi:HAD superfamily hydrolase (TIGR01509 family)|nr:HAD family phosphatase [Candidatus Delongbacteria bacterium]
MKMKFSKYDAIIFDMDGLLLATENICWECFRSACKQFNYDPDFNIYKRIIGRSTTEGNKILSEALKDFIPYEEVNPIWNKNYHDAIANNPIPLKKGVREFLEYVSKLDLKLAVATSTGYDLAVKKLKNTDLYKYFEFVVAGDQVKNSKPDPEIYLTAADKLRVEPKNCLAFEDSDNGTKAAHSAGMTIIQIPDIVEVSDEVRSLGHMIVESFDKFTDQYPYDEE